MTLTRRALPLLLTLALVAGCTCSRSDELTLLNVSYDPTRELYVDVNREFSRLWQEKHGKSVRVKMSHGGAGKQTRAVIDGLEADVVTLAISHDIDMMHEKAKLLPKDWQARLPHDSAPYTTTIVLLVRAGNPKGISDWDDLAKEGVKVITPNPKTSGGARMNYLAAWGYAERKPGGSAEAARRLVEGIYRNVPVLDSGARGATTTFVERGIGDVLITWENEALMTVNKVGRGKFEIVMPSLSISAEPPVALIDKYADKHGTRELAQAYLDFLYSPAGQELAAKHYYRPRDPGVLARHAARFPEIQRFTVKEAFNGWTEVQRLHFADDGLFDRIYRPVN